jgi:hypothetical protein
VFTGAPLYYLKETKFYLKMITTAKKMPTLILSAIQARVLHRGSGENSTTTCTNHGHLDSLRLWPLQTQNRLNHPDSRPQTPPKTYQTHQHKNDCLHVPDTRLSPKADSATSHLVVQVDGVRICLRTAARPTVHPPDATVE